MLPENIVLSPQKISEIIEKSGYNKTQLAGLIGVEPSAISKWVKGNSRPEPANAAKLRKLIPASTHRVMWAEFCAKEHASAGSLPGPEPSPLGPKSLVETIVGILADKFAPLKVNAEELAKKIDVKGIAPDVAGRLLPELRKKEVEEIAQKFEATRADMAAGFLAVIATVVACTHAGGPVSGDGFTRGGGVPPTQFQEANKCYIPVRADPNTLVGTDGAHAPGSLPSSGTEWSRTGR